tara:strand:+ start:195 stop:572 length:378 start_codon:yes stop_codon:yes gene_type:complete
MKTYKIYYKGNTLERLRWVEEKISQWQKKMQDPKLSTYVEFIKYAKIVTKLSKERRCLHLQKNIECKICKDTGLNLEVKPTFKEWLNINFIKYDNEYYQDIGRNGIWRKNQLQEMYELIDNNIYK